jgi:NAD(P)H-flavin reductase
MIDRPEDRRVYLIVNPHSGYGGQKLLLADLRASARAAGIELVEVLSGSDEKWRGARGHVQDALVAMRPGVERASAFLCGMKGMVSGVTEALTAMGMPREQIFLNY